MIKAGREHRSERSKLNDEWSDGTVSREAGVCACTLETIQDMAVAAGPRIGGGQ